MNNSNRPKVFGIGFHKTGTSSLSAALQQLGYRVTGPNGAMDPDISRNAAEIVRSMVPLYDAFRDNPWPLFYKELDVRYPGSKFILTIRPSSEWFASVVRHFGGNVTPMRTWIYGVGSPEGHERLYVDRYERHNREVVEYFEARPESNLLVMEITRGDGWEKLCPFLEAELQTSPFPHRNAAGEREKWQRLAGPATHTSTKEPVSERRAN